MKIEGSSLLGHENAPASDAPTFAAADRASGARLAPDFVSATPADIDRAAALAAAAFEDFRAWDGPRRAALLHRVAELIEANAPAIIARAGQETALPPARLQGETGRTCGQLRLFAALAEEGSWADARIDHADPARKPAPKPDVRSLLRPLGPVAVFGASNFPMAFSVAGGDTASALAAGCPVIFKAHEGHPGTSELVARLIQQAAREAGAPEGLFSLLQGPGRDIGAALVRHPLVKAAGFTGSRAGGRALLDLAAARPEPIPVYAEMGSVNPVFVLPGALAERGEGIAAGLHGSVTLGFGQFCTNPGLVFLEGGGAAETFLATLETLLAATPPGAMLTDAIREGYSAGVNRLSATPGVRTAARVGSAGAALFATDARTFLREGALLEEVFGPSTLAVTCASREEMLEAARRLDGQLTATVHGTAEDFGGAGELFAVLEARAGRLVCNGFPTGVEVCPAMHHGGPYPATGDGRTTSVGTRAILRFARPVCYQDFPAEALPPELQNGNPRGVWRLVDGKLGQH